jgi:hypothetical protein
MLPTVATSCVIVRFADTIFSAGKASAWKGPKVLEQRTYSFWGVEFSFFGQLMRSSAGSDPTPARFIQVENITLNVQRVNFPA